MSTAKEIPLLVWDTHAIAKAEAEFLMGEHPEDYPDEDAAFLAVCNDSDIHEFEWEYMVDRLTEIMEKRNPDGHWYVEMCNFGWRGVNGHKLMSADTGRDFLQKILPQTDCTFRIYAHGDDGLKINNAHHDSPAWKEFYYAVPASMCDHCGDLMGQETGTATPNGTFCGDCAKDELEYAEAVAANEEVI